MNYKPILIDMRKMFDEKEALEYVKENPVMFIKNFVYKAYNFCMLCSILHVHNVCREVKGENTNTKIMKRRDNVIQ